MSTLPRLHIQRLEDIPVAFDAESFTAARAVARSLGGAAALKAYLEKGGFVAEGKLTTHTMPFNLFARMASGVMTQPSMEEENALLGPAAERFLVCNWPERDQQWEDTSAERVGKHRVVTVKDLSWRWFNPIAFALDSDVATLREAIEMLEAMTEASRGYVNKAGWSPRTGMYFHCFPSNTVQSLHLHLVDLETAGPTFAKTAYKSCHVDSVLWVLYRELAAARKGSRPIVQNIPKVPPALQELPAPQVAPQSSASTEDAPVVARPTSEETAPSVVEAAHMEARAEARAEAAALAGLLEAEKQKGATAEAARAALEGEAASLRQRCEAAEAEDKASKMELTATKAQLARAKVRRLVQRRRMGCERGC